MTAQQYIISFLLGDAADSLGQHVFYGRPDAAPANTRIIIQSSSFFDNGIYGTSATLPKAPLAMLPDSDIPFLFGEPRLERTGNGRFVLYADLIASAYFMLSRYEEIIKPMCRDQWGRFLAKDSVVFQEGYGLRPLVDEWGLYLRNLLREAGVNIPAEKRGFRKIYLTHDIDKPFYLESFKELCFQFVRNFLPDKTHIKNPIRAYLTGKGDPLFSFEWLCQQDEDLRHKLGATAVTFLYFLISAKNSKGNKYFPVNHPKYKKMLAMLREAGAEFGLHISHEGGVYPSRISDEIKRLPDCVDKEKLRSRHHYLRWQNPEDIVQMQRAGIKEDFTLGYADSVGFRVGTCRPYRFINPRSKQISNVIIHPMEIMEDSLQESQYMNLDEGNALQCCKNIIKRIHDHNGELVLLFHNSSFVQGLYHASLYKKILRTLGDYGTL